MTFERAGEDTFGSLTKLQLSSFSITVRQFYLPPILTPIWNLCHSSFWYCEYKCFAYTLPIGAKQRPVLSWNRRWRWTHFWSLERWGKTNKKKKKTFVICSWMSRCINSRAPVLHIWPITEISVCHGWSRLS